MGADLVIGRSIRSPRRSTGPPSVVGCEAQQSLRSAARRASVGGKTPDRRPVVDVASPFEPGHAGFKLAARLAAKPADDGGRARTSAGFGPPMTWADGRRWTSVDNRSMIS